MSGTVYNQISWSTPLDYNDYDVINSAAEWTIVKAIRGQMLLDIPAGDFGAGDWLRQGNGQNNINPCFFRDGTNTNEISMYATEDGSTHKFNSTADAIDRTAIVAADWYIAAWSQDSGGGGRVRFWKMTGTGAGTKEVDEDGLTTTSHTFPSNSNQWFIGRISTSVTNRTDGFERWAGHMMWTKEATDAECTEFVANAVNPTNLASALPMDDGTSSTNFDNHYTGTNTQDPNLTGTETTNYSWVTDSNIPGDDTWLTPAGGPITEFTESTAGGMMAMAGGITI